MFNFIMLNIFVYNVKVIYSTDDIVFIRNILRNILSWVSVSLLFIISLLLTSKLDVIKNYEFLYLSMRINYIYSMNV